MLNIRKKNVKPEAFNYAHKCYWNFNDLDIFFFTMDVKILIVAKKTYIYKNAILTIAKNKMKISIKFFFFFNILIYD